jgi:hypothetical protein
MQAELPAAPAAVALLIATMGKLSRVGQSHTMATR